ncbi:MAG: nitroreductase [Marinilabiliales bacterium]|nr:MAG: nitroreductase [Marinilabiliales bacterium]
MIVKKNIPVEYPVMDSVKERWSPRAFSSVMPEDGKLKSMFEAARRAPSAFNGQPWSFIIGKKGTEDYEKIMESLIDWNKKWASTAPVLIVSLASSVSANGKHKNATAEYDTGQAVMAMSLEAMNQGIYTHQMTGFDKEVIRKNFAVKPHNLIVSVIAAGHQGALGQISADMQELEKEVKGRKDFNTFVFSTADGTPSDLF